MKTNVVSNFCLTPLQRQLQIVVNKTLTHHIMCQGRVFLHCLRPPLPAAGGLAIQTC